ncbi:MAG: hypothetical protein GY898_20520 [Proteobacteria bacterium]|nr:hypothetical protein [Pseudomonadota bacterium]
MRPHLIRAAKIVLPLLVGALLLGPTNTLQPLHETQLPPARALPESLALPVGGPTR